MWPLCNRQKEITLVSKLDGTYQVNNIPGAATNLLVAATPQQLRDILAYGAGLAEHSRTLSETMFSLCDEFIKGNLVCVMIHKDMDPYVTQQPIIIPYEPFSSIVVWGLYWEERNQFEKQLLEEFKNRGVTLVRHATVPLSLYNRGTITFVRDDERAVRYLWEVENPGRPSQEYSVRTKPEGYNYH